MKFREWAVFALILFLFWLLAGCAVLERPSPPPPRPVRLDSLERVAQLPPYLVPPPATATARQARQWQAAQRQALGNVNAPQGKLKLKNVGNTDDHSRSTVQHGITGRQLMTGLVIVLVVLLLLKLGPGIVKSFF